MAITIAREFARTTDKQGGRKLSLGSRRRDIVIQQDVQEMNNLALDFNILDINVFSCRRHATCTCNKNKLSTLQ